MNTPPGRNRFLFTVIIATTLGFLIGWVDSSPGWDDTGITVMSLVVGTAVIAFFSPTRVWAWGLCTGLPVVLLNAVAHGNLGSIAAVPVALTGGYFGMLIRRIVRMRQ
jgi:tetrahydromethanopterin S-methyltransferase subunit C